MSTRPPPFSFTYFPRPRLRRRIHIDRYSGTFKVLKSKSHNEIALLSIIFCREVGSSKTTPTSGGNRNGRSGNRRQYISSPKYIKALLTLSSPPSLFPPDFHRGPLPHNGKLLSSRRDIHMTDALDHPFPTLYPQWQSPTEAWPSNQLIVGARRQVPRCCIEVGGRMSCLQSQASQARHKHPPQQPKHRR